MGDVVRSLLPDFGSMNGHGHAPPPIPLSWGDPGMTVEEGGFVLPTGTVAFLLTDVEGSTRRWETEPDAMQLAMARHRSILDAAIDRHGGVCPTVQGEGDSVVAAFSRPSDAVLAARDAQRALVAEAWPTASPLRVRMAVHAGEARFVDDGSYAGQAIIRTARLRAIAHGGQVLVSAAVRDLTVDQVGGEVELVDLGEHRLRDLARPERVYQLVGHGILDAFPPLRSLDAQPNNLPVQLSTFIGRLAEIEAVARLIETSRLVTITGAGGAGKTRLAQRVAAEVLDHFPDGAWWVELGDLRDPAAVAGAIAATVGLATDVHNAVDGLADRFGNRRLLIVLDNCEHLIDAVADLVDRLLHRAHGVSILTTSREPLTVDGEVTWRIPPLSIPDRADVNQVAVAAMSQFDSVQLFLDRARRARSNFRLADDNAADVADICHRLDGIPLAIELAAARCRSLSPAQIRSGLVDTFRLLTGGGRTVLPRHQTLEASIGWSHELLTLGEQTLLRRLAVFNGGCTLDDAEAVVTDETLPRADVLDLLDRLVAQSLLQLDDLAAAPRYRLLETVRLYARQRLVEAGEESRFVAAHAEHFLHLAREVGPRLDGPTDLQAFGRLAAEIDNLRSALDMFAASERWDDNADLLSETLRLWVLVAPSDTARRVSLCLEPGRVTDPERRARALLTRSAMTAFLGNVIASVEDASAALELSHEPRVRGRSLAVLATATAFFDAPSADSVFTQAISELSAAGDLHGEAETRAFRTAVWSGFRADLVRAAELEAEAAPVITAAGGTYLRAYVAGTGAIAWCLRSEFAAALEASAEAERLLTELAIAAGVAPSTIIDFSVVGAALRYARLWAQLMLEGPDAVQSVATAVRDAHTRGDVFTESLLGLWECLRWAASRNAAAAADECERLAILSGGVGGRALEANFWAFAADLTRQLGDNDRAAALIARADSIPADVSPTYVQVRSAITRSRLALAAGELGQAEDLAHEGLVLAHRHTLRYDTGIALTTIVSAELANRDWASAARLGGAVCRLWRDLGLVCTWDESLDRLTADLARAEDALNEPEYAAARAEGESLDLDSAVAYARRARGERRRPAFGWDALTPTEQRVADEVAKGATNPEIAESLLMSRETVKTHLSHIFTKLGVKSRSELAATVATRSAR